MRNLLLIFFIVITPPLIAQKSKPVKATDPFKNLETEVQRVLKNQHGAGVAVAVVHKNKIVYASGFGYRDLEEKLPVTPNTLFAIGSCTKAFTSSLLGILHKEGKIDFDKSPLTYLPGFEFYNTEMNNEIMVSDLMCHRTGLPRHDLSWYWFPTTSRDSLIQRIKYLRPTARVRETFQYNNFMFLLQGVLAEKLTGKSWENNIKEKIFNPLGMSTSNFSVDTMAKYEDASKGYTVIKDSIIKRLDYYNIDGMGPAGSINSSVNEMANWVITWMNKGKFNGREVLPPGYISRAISSQMVAGTALPDSSLPDSHFNNYGFGWFLSSYRGHYRVEHGGNIDGFSASTSFFPTDSMGIIVLTNQNGSAIPGIIRNIIADRWFGLKAVDWLGRNDSAQARAKQAAKKTMENRSENKKPDTHLSHSLKDYAGLFSNPGYGNLDIIFRNDSLFAYMPNGELWLRHYHYDYMQPVPIDKITGIDTANASELKFQFHTDAAGNISMLSMPLQAGIDDLEFQRISKSGKISAEELKKYEGSYELAPGIEAKFYVKGGETLYAFIQGQPEYELIPVGNNKFDLKILRGYSAQFVENEKGEIIAVEFIQPDGTYRAKKKS